MFPKLSVTRGLVALALVATPFAESSAQVSLDIRAQTGDKVKATGSGSKQGSFGAPSINDGGDVGYACVIFGNNISAFNSNAVVYRRSGNKKPIMALQAGQTVANGFMPNPPNGQINLSGSASFLRIGRDVALNGRNQIAFTGELIFFRASVDDEGKQGDPQSQTTASYGSLTLVKKAFQNYPLISYVSFFEDILRRPVSINKTGAIGYNAAFLIATKSIPGIAYAGAKYNKSRGFIPSSSIVATTESTVIGLPYFTIFQSFSQAVIADGNRLFIVADISDDGDEFDGIWQGNNPNIEPVAVKETNAPGGGKFSSFDGTIGPSRNGKNVAFIAAVTGGSGSGVFRSTVDGKSVVRIASIGDNAPGTSGSFSAFELAASNNSGSVAFIGTVPGAESGTRSGIWLTDGKSGETRLMILEQETILVDGTSKRITRLAFNPISGLNNRGQIAVTASFSDRTSAVIVAK